MKIYAVKGLTNVPAGIITLTVPSHLLQVLLGLDQADCIVWDLTHSVCHLIITFADTEKQNINFINTSFLLTINMNVNLLVYFLKMFDISSDRSVFFELKLLIVKASV